MRIGAAIFKIGVRSFVLILMLCFPLSLLAQDSLAGVWQTGEDNSEVKITEQDGVHSGKLISSDNPKAKIGTEILKEFSQVDGAWKGSLYAAKRGKWYKASIVPSSDTLNITVSAGIVTQKVTWNRVSE